MGLLNTCIDNVMHTYICYAKKTTTYRCPIPACHKGSTVRGIHTDMVNMVIFKYMVVTLTETQTIETNKT